MMLVFSPNEQKNYKINPLPLAAGKNKIAKGLQKYDVLVTDRNLGVGTLSIREKVSNKDVPQ